MRIPGKTILLTLLTSSAACSGIGANFKEPEVQLDHVVLRGLSLTGGNLDLVVRVENPNNFRLHGTRLEVGFEVEGSHLGEIAYDDDFTVSENGITTVTLPLRFAWTGVESAVRAALRFGDLPYEMKGQIELRIPWGRTEIPFSREGRVPLIHREGNVAIPGTAPYDSLKGKITPSEH